MHGWVPIRKAALAPALVALFAGAGLKAAAPVNPLATLFTRSDAGLCFQRIYDDAHLRRHAGQKTVSVLMSLDPGKDATGQSVWVRMEMRQKGRAAPALVAASCEWSATANRDTSGMALIPGYPRADGFVCIAIYNNSSAEEAGTMMFDVAPDHGTATAYFQAEGIGLWGMAPGPGSLPLGRGDRVFKLARADMAECRRLEESIQVNE